MRIDKRIQTEEKAIGPFKVSEKETVEVVPFKPNPIAPWYSWRIYKTRNKPEEEDKRIVSNVMPLEEQQDFYYQQLSPIYKLDYLKSLSLGEQMDYFKTTLRVLMMAAGTIYKKNLRKP